VDSSDLWFCKDCQVTDIEIEAKEMMDTKSRLNQIIAYHTGQTVEKVTADSERNYYLSAEEAKAYGIVDEIISFKKALEISKNGK
jgi:ATP-dependent Clp protease protease subunit